MKVVITLTKEQERRLAEEYRTTDSYHGEPLDDKDNFLWYEFVQFRCLNMLSGGFDIMTEAEKNDWACKAGEIEMFLKLYRGE